MTIWAPGMRCVCVAVSLYPPLFDDDHCGVVGQVYTVRDVGPCELEGHLLLWLEELDNSHFVGRTVATSWGDYLIGGEPGLAAELFRPLDESRLDQFRSHLNPVRREEVPA